MFRAIAVCLLLLISSPVLFKTGVLLWYAWNQPEIAAKQCINRHRPVMKCHGKCVLAKQLKKIDRPLEQQKPALPVKLLEKAETPPFLLTDSQVFVAGLAIPIAHHSSVFAVADLPDQMVFQKIFKPPA